MSQRQQGNLPVNDAEALRERARIRASPRLMDIVQKYWDMLPKANDGFGNEVISEASYKWVFKKVPVLSAPSPPPPSKTLTKSLPGPFWCNGPKTASAPPTFSV